MRPSHPLPEISGGNKCDSTNRKRKKKPSSFDAPKRARVQSIDPRMYGAVHLREDMLEAVVEPHPLPLREMRSPSPSSSSSGAPGLSTGEVHQLRKSPSVIEEDGDVVMPNFEKEKARELGLLATMFGDDDGEWGGKESIEGAVSDGSDDISDIVETEVRSATATIEPTHPAPPPARQKHKSLKDMFRPHEEEGLSALSYHQYIS